MTQDIKHAKKVLGLDLDGVIVDHADAKVRLALEFGFSLLPHETQAEMIKKNIPDEILDKILQKLYGEISSQPLFKNAKGTLFKLKAEKTPFYLISRRRAGENRGMAIEILKKNGLWPGVFNESNIFFVDSIKEKNDIAVELGVTHYVDDESRVLDAMTSVSNRFLFDPYGDLKQSSKYVCFSDWHDIESRL